MDISVSGKQVDVGDAFRIHAEDELTDAVTKYFEKAINATVLLSKHGSSMHVDISVHPGPRGLIVQGHGDADEAYPAFDKALERIKSSSAVISVVWLTIIVVVLVLMKLSQPNNTSFSPSTMKKKCQKNISKLSSLKCKPTS